MESNIINWLGGEVTSVLNWIAVILPDSPFRALSYSPVADILPYVNYFIPVDVILDIMASWLVCIGAFYSYSVVMRWVKAID